MSKKTNKRNAGEELHDIVIPVMGPTGAGKSTFINTLLWGPTGDGKSTAIDTLEAPRERSLMKVGHSLASCTKDIQTAKITYRGRRLVLVDTPGFDDSHQDDTEILKKIADWLKTAYKSNLVIGGIIYLHDVSATRFTGTARQNLVLFNKMCGDAALSKVVIGATHYGDVDRETAEKRLKELKEVYWADMVRFGAQVCKAENSQESGLSLIDTLLRLQAADIATAILAIQKQMVVEGRQVPETDAGKELRYTLQQVLEYQKRLASFDAGPNGDDPNQQKLREEHRQQMDRIADQIYSLWVPLPRTLRSKFFRLFRSRS